MFAVITHFDMFAVKMIILGGVALGTGLKGPAVSLGDFLIRLSGLWSFC